MAGNITTNGQASWGVSGTQTVVTGVVTEMDNGVEAIMAEQRNEIGQVIKKTLYDEHKTVNVTVEVAAGTAAPKVGAAASVGGVSGYVTSARVVESNQAYRKITFSMEAYKNCTAVEKVGGAGA